MNDERNRDVSTDQAQGLLPDFLSVPNRASKPRQHGITHVIDKGMSVRQLHDMLDASGDYIDIVKMGWGTGYVSPQLTEKVRVLGDSGIPAVIGGTFFEVALAQNKFDRWRSWMDELGLTHVEVSDGTITLPHERKLEFIRRLASDFVVLSEVGSKDLDVVIAPYKWVTMIEEELRAGAWKVITEARESGTAGIFRGSGEVRMGLIDEIVHAIDPNRLLFEAPQKAQQVWFVQKFGPNVNVGNIPPDEVIPLETLRLGLRSDTLRYTIAENVNGDGI